MLYQIIKHIYPLIKDADFLLQDDGEGVYIKLWNYNEPQPTEQQINDAAKIVQFKQAIADFEQAVQAELDADAQAKGYDNIISACAYAGASNPFQAESKLFITRRGNVWAYCYAELEKVQNGTRHMPTIEQIISELPARVSA